MVIDNKLAHKIQNELTAIMGFVDMGLLYYEEDNDVKGSKALEQAKKTIHALSFMVNKYIRDDITLSDDTPVPKERLDDKKVT